LLGVSLVTVPSSLTFISEHKTTSPCLCACYRQNGDLLVGTSGGLNVLRRGEHWMNPCSTDVMSVTSVVQHHQNVFILRKNGNIFKVEMCLAGDITKRQQLFQFHRTRNGEPVMAVSDRYIVVKNSDTKDLIVYDFESQQTKRTYCNLQSLQFLPDGCLLGVSGSELRKYKIDNRELVELWTCDDIIDGYSICTDYNGLIYVTASILQMMFVISSQGAATYDNL